MVNYSIIIPHKNIPELLERCVASIPERDDIQIIVVDDGSDTPPVIKRAGVEVVYSESKNAGAARNIGLARARGEWLIFADADDFFLPAVGAMMDKYVDSRADIIYFESRWRYSNTGKPCKKTTYQQRRIEAYLKTGNEDGLRYGMWAPWAKFIRHDMVKKHRLCFSEIKYSNDVLFSTMGGHYANRIECERTPVYCHEIRPDSLSGADNEASIDSIMIRFKEDIAVVKFARSVGRGDYFKRSLLRRWKRIMRIDRRKATESLPLLREFYPPNKIAGLRFKLAFEPLIALFRKEIKK